MPVLEDPDLNDLIVLNISFAGFRIPQLLHDLFENFVLLPFLDWKFGDIFFDLYKENNFKIKIKGNVIILKAI